MDFSDQTVLPSTGTVNPCYNRLIRGDMVSVTVLPARTKWRGIHRSNIQCDYMILFILELLFILNNFLTTKTCKCLKTFLKINDCMETILSIIYPTSLIPKSVVTIIYLWLPMRTVHVVFQRPETSGCFHIVWNDSVLYWICYNMIWECYVTLVWHLSEKSWSIIWLSYS